MLRIESIELEAMCDDSPGTSWLGEYTDDLGPGVIVRPKGEFYERLPAEMERDCNGRFLYKGKPDVPPPGRGFRGFKPYAGGEKVGTPLYYKYGMRDYKRMEGLNRGDWRFIGIRAKAEVSYPVNGRVGDWRLETLTSSGLWGIASDSEDSHIKEFIREELEDLKDHLATFNVDLSNWEELTKDIEIRNI